MTQSNNDNKLKDPSIRRLFEGENFVFISTLMKDGTPHLSPTGKLWLSQHLDSIGLSNSDKTDLLIAIENNRAK
jgi:hypothetical protein